MLPPMTVMQTGALQMPPVLAKKLINDVKTKSTVAELAAKEPKLFGADEKYIQFTSKPRAQFVEEGQAEISSGSALLHGTRLVPQACPQTGTFSGFFRICLTTTTRI